VLRLLPALPAVIVVDGYVWLPDGRPGLGAHLYEALARCAAVVGIAKRPFEGIGESDCVLPVLRGALHQPLFVAAQGMSNAAAARAVRSMAGKHRIPDVVRMADRLSRERTDRQPRSSVASKQEEKPS
jgi:deoxyribonuclease V